MTTDERLAWLDPAPALDAACAACRNTVANEVFLRVANDAQSVRGGPPVEVARCGTCASAWFPSMTVSDSYPRAERASMTDDFWLLIDHYVELVGGLEWKVFYAEQLPHIGVQRVLEVGCNTGLLLDYVHRMWGVEVIGLEPSAYGMAGAERLGLAIESRYMADLIAAGIEQFDLVMSTEVIEHVEDPGHFLRELRMLVRSGGVALVTTPNAEALTAAQTPGDLYGMLSIGSHRMVLSARRLTELAHAAGFASAQVRAAGTTLICVLADEPVELTPAADPRPHLLAYHTARLDDPEPDGHPTRPRLADLIARYVIARELETLDALHGEAEIDDLLRNAFDVEVLDLASVVARAERATDIFEFGQIAPFSLAAYLFHRGQRDDISEQARTEMWEAAVTLIGRGMAVDPVNLFLLERTLDVTLDALAGRPSRRWNDAARRALASSPELRDRVLPRVTEPPVTRFLRAARRRIPLGRG